MATKNNFASEESYKRYKRREYERYYVPSQMYPKRIWTQEDIEMLIANYDLPARELSVVLHRSVKAIEHRRRVLRRSGLVAAL